MDKRKISARRRETAFIRIFDALRDHFGDLHWWPAENGFEVAIGAILTQNTAWINVEKAIANLKAAIDLSPSELLNLARPDLETLIRPAGFFRQKSAYLQGFAAYLLDTCEGDIGNLCTGTLDTARRRLLALRGIGAETADSILLYAGNRPSFVIDAYTRRVFCRLGLVQGQESYDVLRSMFMASLPQDPRLFNEYHALIVEHAKTFCRKRQPLCKDCPLLTFCASGQKAS
jgi:endonuclease-3 related protein